MEGGHGAKFAVAGRALDKFRGAEWSGGTHGHRGREGNGQMNRWRRGRKESAAAVTHGWLARCLIISHLSLLPSRASTEALGEDMTS